MYALLLLGSEYSVRPSGLMAITQGIDTTTSMGRMLYGQLAVFAEFEREQISDRTKAGMEAAKRRGKHIGRPVALTDDQVREAVRSYEDEGRTIRSLAEELGVSVQTLTRAMKRGSQNRQPDDL